MLLISTVVMNKEISASYEEMGAEKTEMRMREDRLDEKWRIAAL